MKKIRYALMFGMLATSTLPLGCAQDPEEGSQVLATPQINAGGGAAQTVSPLGQLLDPKDIFGTPKDVANGPTVKEVVASSVLKGQSLSEVRKVPYDPITYKGGWVKEFGDGFDPKTKKLNGKGHCDLHPVSKADSNQRSRCLQHVREAYDICLYNIGMKKFRKDTGILDNLTKSKRAENALLGLGDENQKWKMCFFKAFLTKFPYNIKKGPSGSGGADCTVEGHGANCDAVVAGDESGTTSTQAPASSAPASAGTNPSTVPPRERPPAKPAAPTSSSPTPPASSGGSGYSTPVRGPQ